MMRKHFNRDFVYAVMTVAVTAVLFSSPRLNAQPQQGENKYLQTNLVSNGYTPAKVTDPNLVNPWGMVEGPTSPTWTSNQTTNTASVYTIDDVEKGKGALLTVNIPTEMGGPNGPTGVVFNTFNKSSTDFEIPSAMGMGMMVPSFFIFANLNGTISGWNPGSTGGLKNAVIAVDNHSAGAIYTGLALGMVGSKTYLYATNFTPMGGVEVYDTSFKPATGLQWNSSDADNNLPELPRGRIWKPYNIANIDGMMYVAYAAMPATGGLPIIHMNLGAIAVFTPQGKFIKVLAKEGQLDAPWGMVMAPNHFGKFSNDLLVGNFGNGHILAYRMIPSKDAEDQGDHGRDTFAGLMRDSNHKIIEEGFLWTLMFGNGANGSNPDTLYITSGGHNQAKEGLFAAITPAKADRP